MGIFDQIGKALAESFANDESLGKQTNPGFRVRSLTPDLLVLVSFLSLYSFLVPNHLPLPPSSHALLARCRSSSPRAGRLRWPQGSDCSLLARRSGGVVLWGRATGRRGKTSRSADQLR
eukprot:388643-Hanusia_phi.AAC.1